MTGPRGRGRPASTAGPASFPRELFTEEPRGESLREVGPRTGVTPIQRADAPDAPSAKVPMGSVSGGRGDRGHRTESDRSGQGPAEALGGATWRRADLRRPRDGDGRRGCLRPTIGGDPTR